MGKIKLSYCLSLCSTWQAARCLPCTAQAQAIGKFDLSHRIDQAARSAILALLLSYQAVFPTSPWPKKHELSFGIAYG
jgi:hypothetical protein